MEPAERHRLVAQALIDRAKRAREDPVAFLDFVARDEMQKKVGCAPHQELMLSFVLEAKCMRGLRGQSVVIAPIEHGKTHVAGILTTLWEIGRNPNLTGAIVSKTQDQAKKTLNAIRHAIESSVEYHLVFPDIKRSTKDGDPWTQTAITVDRKGGGKDPTLHAYGVDSPAITGSRLGWIICDDLLCEENTATPEQREKIRIWFHKYVLSRLLPGGTIIMINSAVHPEDLLHDLENLSWPTMRMDAYGAIRFSNTTFGMEGQSGEDLVEPDEAGSDVCVLSKMKGEQDPDKRTLFPARFTITRLDDIKSKTLPIVFASNFQSICRDDEAAMCKEEYIEKCKALGRRISLHAPVRGKTEAQDGYQFTGAFPVFHGVDLAVKKGEKRDYVALFTIELRDFPEFNLAGVRVVLDVEYGQWPGPEIVRKIIARYDRYGGEVVVEDNGAQAYIRQFTLEQRTDLLCVPYVTNATKHHAEYGVPGVFGEMAQGAWALPNLPNGAIPYRGIARFVRECLYYEPDKHTGDILMAGFFARERARKFQAAMSGGGRRGGSIGMQLLAR